MKIRGKAWKFGDDVNTDIILPGKYLELTDPREMAKHAMEGIDPVFSDRIQLGDIVVAGSNFGCGSSREHAPMALKYAGIGAVVAESYARIFYRNAINIGLPALECPGISAAVDEGNLLEVDPISGSIEDITKGIKFQATPLPEFMVDVLIKGGLASYLREHIDEWME